MMPRQHSIDSNSSNSNSNMNINANMNYTGRGGGNSNPGVGKGDQARNRYSHHGPGGGDSGEGGGDSAPGGSSSRGGVGHADAGATAASAMGDYSGLQNHQFPLQRTAAGLTPGLGPFNPAFGGMNPAAMNPSLYPHLGGAAAASAAALQQHQMAQQASGEHLDYSNRGSSGVPGNASSVSQAEREEELLLNLLIARRQRQAMRTSEPQMGPSAEGGGQSTSWTDDWMRLRQQQDQLGASGGGTGGDSQEALPGSLQVGEGSRRTSTSARMNFGTGAGAAGGMGQLANNMNMNMNMPGAGAVNQHQFLSDSSARLQQQRGSSMGLQMGSPGWGNAAAMANAGAMHNDSMDAFAHQRSAAQMSMVSNTQLQLDVLQRADPMMGPNMMYDARMAEQSGMGQNPYHQFSMGRQQGQTHLHDRQMGFGKRQADPHGIKGLEKQGTPQNQMQQFFASPQKPTPTEEAAQPAKKRRLHKKKPADMPRRPLSAYNLFFSEERERILKEIEGKAGEEEDKDSEGKAGDDEKPKALLRPLLPSEKKRRPHRRTHGKISFQELATKVGQRWKALPDDRRKYYQDLAQEDMKRQKKAMEEYYQKRSALTTGEATTTD